MRCPYPIVIERKNYELAKAVNPNITRYVKVPCGKCLQCVTNYVLSWCFRLELECKTARAAYFVTLTYDEENCPENVSKSDIQKYFKRMRKNSSIKDFKYVCISEYTPTGSHRPHYHIIMFNVDQETIRTNWNFGFVTLGFVNPARIGYVMSFHFLRSTFVPDGHTPNFKLQSQGLGLNGYYAFEKVNAINNDYRYLVTERNYRVAVPRFFRDKDGYKFPPESFDNLESPPQLTREDVYNINSQRYFKIYKYIENYKRKKIEK